MEIERLHILHDDIEKSLNNRFTLETQRELCILHESCKKTDDSYEEGILLFNESEYDNFIKKLKFNYRYLNESDIYDLFVKSKRYSEEYLLYYYLILTIPFVISTHEIFVGILTADHKLKLLILLKTSKFFYS